MTLESTLKTLAFAAIGSAVLSLGVNDAPASAAIITGNISGTVTEAGGGIPGVTVGSLIAGFYSYDDAIETSNPAGPLNPLTAFNLQIGTNPQIFTLTDIVGPFSAAPGRRIDLSTPAQDVLAFGFRFPSLSDFAGANAIGQSGSVGFPQIFSVRFDDPTLDFEFNLVATSSDVPTPIPTPALLPGLVGIGLKMWRKRKTEATASISN